MSKSFCGLHGLSTKKSTITKVKARHELLHIAADSVRSHD